MMRLPASICRAASVAASRPAAVISAFSGTMLLGALAFEHIGGMPPCHLCMNQRYAHACAALVALAATMFRGAAKTATTIAAAAVLLSGSAVAAYHVGVESHLWGASCALNIGVTETVDNLRAALLGIATAPCDLVAWSMFGISMAGWNALMSAAVGLWAFRAAFPVARWRKAAT